MQGKTKIIDSIVKGTLDVIHTEDIVVDAVRDLVRDEIKRYIRDKIEKNPQLKKEMREAIGEFIEAKIKEAYALVKIGKCGAKLSLDLLPSHLREEFAKEVLGIFEEEIGAIIDKAL